jgi:aspartyl-tRNA(Asn)/glutamyl-tRNA(Gln) amidotransferase subunit A
VAQRLADEIQDLSLCEVADLIKTGQVSATETLQACLEQIDRLDPVCHAFVWQNRESALARAGWLDAIRSAGETLGPLHGVPMAHKDMYYRTGRVSACGSRIRRNETATTTATVLRKLDGAGAIDVGGLAMVEFAMGPHGFNAHLPRALNPWDHGRVPCGSSSGSGVAVASRMVYASLGSDTGGSVRCPAAANGIVGCLPTYGLVSRRGVMPMSWSLDCVGPLTRTVRDAARVLRTIAGPDALDDTASGTPVPDYEADLERVLGGVRIGVAEGYFDEELDPDVQAVVAASLEVFRDAGAILVPVKIPESVSIASSLHPLVMKAEGSANHRPWKRARSAEYSDEVGKRLEAGFFISASDYINALQYRAFALEDFLDTVFSKVDVLHTPVLPIPTPTLAQTAYSNGPAYLKMVVALTRNTRVINFLGLPALSVTCGHTCEGMPTSFQLVGRPFSESLLFRLGHRYQTETKLHLEMPRALGNRAGGGHEHAKAFATKPVKQPN